MSTFWILLEQMELFVIYILAGVILVKSGLFYVAMFFLSMGIAGLFHVKGKRAQIYQTMSMFGNIGFMGMSVMTSVAMMVTPSDSEYAMGGIFITTICSLVTLPFICFILQ